MLELYQVIQKWGKETVSEMITRIQMTENYSGYMRGDIRLLQSFNPELVANAEEIMWELSLPSYAENVDKGLPPGTLPSAQDIFRWSLNRGLPEEGDRRTFVYHTRRLVQDRGVIGSNFFEIFTTRLGVLDEQLYNIVSQVIDEKLLELQNKYSR